jgi:SAM-dependent methyltransferase
MLSVQTQSEHLESSAFLRKYAIQIVQHARDLPILDVGCGSGRHAFLLTSLGANVICLDRDLERFEFNRNHQPTNVRLRPMHADLLRDPWPFRESTLGGILAIHFLVAPALFVHFADSLTPEGRLLIETVGGHGGNYLELPRAGQLRRALSGSFDFEFYHERKVGPAGTDSVSVRLLQGDEFLTAIAKPEPIAAKVNFEHAPAVFLMGQASRANL